MGPSLCALCFSVFSVVNSLLPGNRALIARRRSHGLVAHVTGEGLAARSQTELVSQRRHSPAIRKETHDASGEGGLMARITRRGFVKGSLAAAGPFIVPAWVLGQNAPSNRINVGIIG